jgi:LacI family transcriptional regulator
MDASPGPERSGFPSYESIAARAGVSRSTVSRALRNDPRISKETATRVRDAAQSLGYRPNPLLAALMERVRHGREVSYQGTLAVITEAEDAARWYGTASSWENIHRGAVQRAHERGYQMEFFSTRHYDKEGRRLSQILRSRGIHGVYVAPGFSERRARLDWSAFSAATTGYGLVDPALHRVCYNNYHGIQLACRRLQDLGYKRIGLYLEQRNDEVTDHNYLAGFLLFLESVAPRQQIRPVLVPKYERQSFQTWLEQSEPDAVISSTRLLLEWAREKGAKCPDELGFVHLDHHARLSGCAGINHNSELIGAAVVDLIVAQLHRGEIGLPQHAMTTVVEGFWVHGETVRNPAPDREASAPIRTAAKSGKRR